MKKLLFILMLGSLFAQDELILLNGESIKGEYIKTEGDKIYFKPQDGLAVQSVNQDMVQEVILFEDKKQPSIQTGTVKKGYAGGVLIALGGGMLISQNEKDLEDIDDLDEFRTTTPLNLIY